MQLSLLADSGDSVIFILLSHDTRPSALELSALLEKQNKVLSALLGKLATSKSEVLVGNRSSQQINDGGTQDKKQVYAKNSFKGFLKTGAILPDGNEESLILENCLEEIRNAHRKVENLERKLEVKKTELAQANETNSLKQIRIDHLNELIEKEREARNSEFSKLNDLLVDKKEKRHKATAKELAKRNKEDKVLVARLSVLADENITLRSLLLTLGTSELSPQLKKLLEEQRDFIETLKSECEILMNRLVRGRDEHRKERRQLRRQIRTLNARLECLISGKQEIMRNFISRMGTAHAKIAKTAHGYHRAIAKVVLQILVILDYSQKRIKQFLIITAS
uniref:DUF4515 domain-containing protein n=1 Tax=Loa loa TaxID=7209 RepID=A0A1I7VQX1_LOALO